MTHPADPVIAATLRQARARAWGESRPLRTHYPGEHALGQASAGRLVVESVRAENAALSDEHAEQRRDLVGDELTRRGLFASADAARSPWTADDDEQSRRDREEALERSAQPVAADPAGWALASGLVTAAAMAATSEVLLEESIDHTVASSLDQPGPDPVVDGAPTIGLTSEQMDADLGGLDLGPMPGIGAAAGAAVGQQIATDQEPTHVGEAAPEPSVEVGASVDVD